MKQLIKSATIYNAELPSAALLRGHLADEPFSEPLSAQAISAGFAPREDFGDLVDQFAGGLAFTVRIDQKLVPGSVLKAETQKLAQKVEADTGHKVGKKERAELKEQALYTLLEHAFVRTTLVTCYHHTATNMLIIPTNNKTVAQRIVTLLVNAVGSVKTTTINVADVKGGLTTRLKKWLEGDLDAFAGMDPTSEVQLEQDDRKVSVRMTDLDSAHAALTEAMASSFTVKALGLRFMAGTEMRLTDSFQLRGISFANAVVEDDDMDVFASEAAIEVSELVEAITFLCEMFGYAVEPEVAA